MHIHQYMGLRKHNWLKTTLTEISFVSLPVFREINKQTKQTNCCKIIFYRGFGFSIIDFVSKGVQNRKIYLDHLLSAFLVTINSDISEDLCMKHSLITKQFTYFGSWLKTNPHMASVKWNHFILLFLSVSVFCSSLAFM